MIVGIIIGLTVAAVLYITPLAWRRWKSRTRIVDECSWCGEQVSGRHAHLLVEHPADQVEAQFAAWGGTAVSATACAKHCPGGCTNRRCRAKMPV